MAFFARGWNRAWTIAQMECRDLKRWERITKRAIKANLRFRVQAQSAAKALEGER